ncbi:MAG: zinc ribbon domain-containing protein [Acidobacteriota bacterium]|jgi:putative FmdB family regulatory protein|nr:zinc ribbon domain-containing protein [Acidobacteriota bacterium]NLT32269.1 zinc ribbon domain-containing protein [Acidobacteriota bacterium]
MPIYEYHCRACRRRMSFLVMTPSTFEPECRFCGGRELERLFSRFSSPKSEEQRLESLADPASLAGLDESDPGSVARWVKKMGGELGDDLDGGEIDELAERAAAEASGPDGEPWSQSDEL